MWELWLAVSAGVAFFAVVTVALLLARSEGQAVQNVPILTLAGTFVALGIIFGDDRLIGYSFLSIGLMLSVLYAVSSSRKKMIK